MPHPTRPTPRRLETDSKPNLRWSPHQKPNDRTRSNGIRGKSARSVCVWRQRGRSKRDRAGLRGPRAALSNPSKLRGGRVPLLHADERLLDDGHHVAPVPRVDAPVAQAAVRPRPRGVHLVQEPLADAEVLVEVDGVVQRDDHAQIRVGQAVDREGRQREGEVGREESKRAVHRGVVGNVIALEPRAHRTLRLQRVLQRDAVGVPNVDRGRKLAAEVLLQLHGGRPVDQPGELVGLRDCLLGRRRVRGEAC
mmetsp:Transcript_53715/g.165267  ORF Transcript_53715/g.165267 Transcript_53715/m.165267 type:complete len:251 (-) Transcript_53715:445-1197(-)